MRARRQPTLALTLGDPAGIGPELIAKLMARGELMRQANAVLVGDPFQARAALLSQREGWLAGYIDHVGFTLIALFEGFIIVAGIDVGAPGWLTAAVAVLGVVVGNRVLHTLQHQGDRPGRAVS